MAFLRFVVYFGLLEDCAWIKRGDPKEVICHEEKLWWRDSGFGFEQGIMSGPIDRFSLVLKNLLQ